MNASPSIAVPMREIRTPLPGTNAVGLNENHLRSVRVTLQCIDDRLSEVDGILTNAGCPSPFQKYSDDSTPIQRKVVHDYITQIREAMRRILAKLDIPQPAPVCGALWAASTSVLFAKIDAEEMASSRISGFGPLSSTAATSVETICAEMKAMLGKLNVFLSDPVAGDLKARLANLKTHGDEKHQLQELERMVTEHGLVEFRGAIAMLLDRLEVEALEIGFFGRVSSGKSSLLDYLLETSALPVGVTPVTAVPTRITYGQLPQAYIEFADSEAREIDLTALAEYASEQKNPGNTKHVSRISVQLPAWRLHKGVVFADTPGLGSLAVAGAEETAAYLPRCDLGVVLIDSSAGPTEEDFRLVQALHRAGADMMILLSKADLLSEGDRVSLIQYFSKKLQEQVGISVPIHEMSVVGEHAVMADNWWNQSMNARMEKHRELMWEARQRKINILQKGVLLALRLRSRAELGENARTSNVDSELTEAERLLDFESKNVRKLRDSIEESAPKIVAALATKLAQCWGTSQNADVRQLFSETVAQVLAEPTMAFPSAYQALRRSLSNTLEPSVDGRPESFADLPHAAAMPILDSSALTGRFTIDKPKLLWMFGEEILTQRLQVNIEKQVGGEMRALLARYARQLDHWLESSIEGLRRVFEASADIQRAKRRFGNWDAGQQAAFERDIALLEQWTTH